MASSSLCFVASEELLTLAERFGSIDISEVEELLGLNHEVATSISSDNDEQRVYKLLVEWRDGQAIGSDIRGSLAQKLRCRFPEESENLLIATPTEESKNYTLKGLKVFRE